MIEFFTSTLINGLSGIDLNIVFDGNSLTRGFNGAGIEQYYPKQVEGYLLGKTKGLTFNSLGISGQTLTTMLSNAPANIDTLVDYSKENLIVVWEDANDLLMGNVTGQQNYDNMQNYVNGRYVSGYDNIIVIGGYYPRLPYDLFTPTQAALDAQHDYFELLNTNPLGDNYIDLRDAQHIGGDREQNQDAAYFNDYIHLLATGYDIIADKVVSDGILKLYPS